MSIPRDTMVPIPECTRDDGTVVPAQAAQMFNEAFSEGGPACTIKTVEKLTKIRIDNYIVVDFSGFKDMVNALGGVKVCLPYAVNDPQSHLDLAAGTHTVKGQQALAYVRTRHGLGDGWDLSRIDRQQAFIGSMVSKVKDKGLLLRPDRLYNFLAAATKSLTTDFGGLKDMARARPGRPRPAHQGRHLPHRAQRAVGREPEPRPAQAVGRDGVARAALRPAAARQGAEAELVRVAARRHRAGRRWSPPPESISVTVLNGSGTAGAASDLAEELTAGGFNVVSVGNADRS